MARTGNSNLASQFSKRTKAPAAPSRSRTKKKLKAKPTATKSRKNRQPASAPKRELHPRIKASIPPLWDHQKESLEFLKNLPRHLDLSDPGTAKTRVQLELFAERRRSGSLAALVLAPKSLLETAWADDAYKYTPDMMVSVAYAENRQKAFDAKADIYITNVDAVNWLVKQPKNFFKKFDTIIIDELISFKHRTSARSKALDKILQHDTFTYRSGLNGTLTSGRVLEAWNQVRLIDDGKHLGNNFFRFRATTHEAKEISIGRGKTALDWIEKEGAIEAVASILSDISIRHAFEEVMDVPENYSRTVTYHPSAKMIKAYKAMEQQALLAFKDGKKVKAANAAVLRTKLLQIASGAVYTGEGEDSEDYKLIDTGRYELILDLATEVDHSVVFFNWSHQKNQLIETAKKRKVAFEVIDGAVPTKKRRDIVHAYQEGEYQTLFMHPQTGAHGLTLTRGTRTIWSSPIYRPDFLKQGNHRIYRGGQTQKTETLLIKAAGTVEGLVYKKLNEANAKMVGLLDLLSDK